MSDLFWRFNGNELSYIQDALESGLHNKWNKIFEEKFADIIGVKYAVGVNSGTSALHSALYAVGVREGDEVIVPPLTFGAPAFAALLLNAIPVFTDIDPHSFTLDQIQIEKKITEKTKAIIPVSLYGLPAQTEVIMEIAKRHDLFVIEDNAECILGRYSSGQIAGSIADISIFSFQRSKHITCETGGAVLTNNEELAEKIRKYSILGYKSLRAKSGTKTVTMDEVQSPNFDRHELVAPNYRLSELCAAMLTAQLERIEDLVNLRIEIAKEYLNVVNSCKWLLPQRTPSGFTNSYWTFSCIIDNNRTEVDYDKFRKEFLNQGGEPFYAAWKLNYLEPALYGRKIGDYKMVEGLCPVAESIQKNILQFKTNFQSVSEATKQAKILSRTIENLT